MPFTLTAERAKLRAQFERDVLAEISRAGPAGFRRHEMVARWAHAGPPPSSIWRWLKEMLDDADGAGRHFVRRPAPQADVAGSGTTDVHQALSDGMKIVDSEAATKPVTAQPHAVLQKVAAHDAPPGSTTPLVLKGTFDIEQHLQRSIASATRVMNAQCAPHDPRSARLMLRAAEVLRRCAETVIRLHEKIWNMARIEEFHAMVIETVREESPQAADKILDRLEALAALWANSPAGGGPPR